MGLDCSAYKNVKLYERQDLLESELDNLDEMGLKRLYINQDFPERCTEWPNKAIVSAERGPGDYGRAYSGYNRWRERLAELAGYPKVLYKSYENDPGRMRADAGAWEVDHGPFWELICFSDCEGIIGTAVSKKLLADFIAFEEQAKLVTDDRFWDGYQSFKELFETASQDGYVSFH